MDFESMKDLECSVKDLSELTGIKRDRLSKMLARMKEGKGKFSKKVNFLESIRMIIFYLREYGELGSRSQKAPLLSKEYDKSFMDWMSIAEKEVRGTPTTNPKEIQDNRTDRIGSPNYVDRQLVTGEVGIEKDIEDLDNLDDDDMPHQLNVIGDKKDG